MNRANDNTLGTRKRSEENALSIRFRYIVPIELAFSLELSIAFRVQHYLQRTTTLGLCCRFTASTAGALSPEPAPRHATFTTNVKVTCWKYVLHTVSTDLALRLETRIARGRLDHMQEMAPLRVCNNIPAGWDVNAICHKSLDTMAI